MNRILTMVFAAGFLLSSGCQSVSPTPTKDSAEQVTSLVFECTEDFDIIGMWRRRIDFHHTTEHTAIKFTSQETGSGTPYRTASVQITERKWRRLVDEVESMPAGYWDRKIEYSPNLGGEQVVIFRAPIVLVEIRYANGKVRQIKTDGLDDRLYGLFEEAIKCLPRAYRFRIEKASFSVDAKDADGPFVWRVLDAHDVGSPHFPPNHE